MKKRKLLTNEHIMGGLYNLGRSIWLFPLCVLALIIGLASLGVSGSSVGIYDGILNAQIPHQSGIISFQPRAVRSDEWLVNTQMTVAQHSAGFPMVNKNIGQGEDMSVVLDVPYKDWSLLFRPQNLIFFITPLNFAFAFKWWFLGGLLAVSSYLFLLKLLPKQRLVAVFFAIILFFTPMVQWWYQSITILPLAFSFLILTLLMTIHQVATIKKRLLIMLCLAYLCAAFGFVMYPPFQIPVLLVVVAFYISFFASLWFKKGEDRKALLKVCSFVGGGLLLAVSIIAIFLVEHKSTVQTIVNSAYPAKRDVLPGSYPLGNPFTGYLSVFLQFPTAPTTYKELYPVGSNQSESSNFTLPTLVFLGLALLLATRYRKKIDSLSFYLLLGLSVICLLFFLNIYLPFGHIFYKLIALTLVPHTRLLMGLGFVAALLLVVLSRLFQLKKVIVSQKVALVFLGISSVISLFLTYILSQRNPGYITQPITAIIVSLLIPVSLFFLFRAKLRLAFFSLAILSVISSWQVNPVNRNLDEITDTSFAQTIHAIVSSHPSARWVSNGLVLENYAVANGAKSIGGIYSYSQLAIWKNLDPRGNNEPLYNRYAHVSFIFDDHQKKAAFSLPAGDNFLVKISACDAFFKKLSVDYFYGSAPISSGCLQLIAQLTNNTTTIFIYKRH